MASLAVSVDANFVECWLAANPLGMPALTAGTVGLYNTYAWALVATVLFAVITGYGRRRA